MTVTLAFAFASAIVFASKRTRRARHAFLMFALLLSLPGFVCALTLRADSPREVFATARAVASLESSMSGFALAHGCAVVTRNDCAACEPIARLATARPGSCIPSATIELDHDALSGRCVTRGATLRCGR